MRSFGAACLSEVERRLGRYNLTLKEEDTTYRDSASQRNRQKIEQAIAAGASTRHEIAEQTKLYYQTVCAHLKVAPDLAAKVSKEKRGKQKIDGEKAIELAKQGLNLHEISRLAGRVTKECVRQYLLKTGHDAERKNAKRAIRQAVEEEQTRKELIGEIAYLALANAHEGVGFVDGATFRYQQEKQFGRPGEYSEAQLRRIFGTYERATEQILEKGEGTTLEKLAEQAGIILTCFRHVILSSGLSPIWRKQERKPTLEWKKEALRRIAQAGTQLGAEDLGHFLNVPAHVAYQTLVRQGGKSRGGLWRRIPIRDALRSGQRKLSYKLASQIYESLDEGYGISDTASIVGVSPDFVETTWEYRGEITPEIKKALRTMFPDRKIKKPYL